MSQNSKTCRIPSDLLLRGATHLETSASPRQLRQKQLVRLRYDQRGDPYLAWQIWDHQPVGTVFMSPLLRATDPPPLVIHEGDPYMALPILLDFPFGLRRFDFLLEVLAPFSRWLLSHLIPLFQMRRGGKPTR